MHNEEAEQDKDLKEMDTTTYLYPSSDNTVLLQDVNYDDMPFITGKHSILPGAKAESQKDEDSSGLDTAFIPKTQPQEQHVPKHSQPKLKKKRGCLRSAIFGVIFVVIVAAALWFVFSTRLVVIP